MQNNLADLRLKRGLSVAQLAAAVGISRQTIYAMESGSYVPNTLVALKLAQVLAVGVEELFRLDVDLPAPVGTREVEFLPGERDIQAGQPLRLCRVNGRLVGVSPETGTWSLPAADAIVTDSGRGGKRTSKARARVLGEDWRIDKRVLIAGCDPGVSVLGRHLHRQDVELIVTYQNSSRSLELLKEGLVHIAGSHIRDEKTGESNLPAIKKMFGKEPMAVFSFAVWEEGIVVARGNPKQIRSVADFVRPDVTIVNRDPGAGSRILLDSQLQALGISGSEVNGYDRIALGHLPAARQILTGQADCSINTKPAARVLGLDFVPLVAKRYDLVIRTSHLKLPQIQTVLETLGRAYFRCELEGLGDYDMNTAGSRLI